MNITRLAMATGVTLATLCGGTALAAPIPDFPDPIKSGYVIFYPGVCVNYGVQPTVAVVSSPYAGWVELRNSVSREVYGAGHVGEKDSTRIEAGDQVAGSIAEIEAWITSDNPARSPQSLGSVMSNLPTWQECANDR